MNAGILIVLLGCISIALAACSGCAQQCAYTHGHNGRPTCTAAEMTKRWRNNNDPTRYWACNAVGRPADAVLCQTSYMFLVSAQECVHNSKWYWTPPCDPPTLAVTPGSGSC